MTDRNDAPDGFLSRWARRKAAVQDGTALPEVKEAKAAPAPTLVPSPPPSRLATPPAPAAVETALGADAADPSPPPPSLDDVALLDRDSDYRRFVAPGVTPEVRNAALKRLFTDPRFNVMDGLDTYIDDYGKPDPIPPAMLRQMVQSRFLGLFDAEEDDKKSQPAGAIPDGATPLPGAQSNPEPTLAIADDQDAAVRLQPLDAAGPRSDPGGPGEDAGRER